MARGVPCVGKRPVFGALMRDAGSAVGIVVRLEPCLELLARVGVASSEGRIS
jgi:hypothetical protein